MGGWKIYSKSVVENLRVRVKVLEMESSIAQDFMKAIEAQNWDALSSYDVGKENSRLIQTLISLKEALVNFNRKEREKIWVNESLADISSLMQKHHGDLTVLANEVLKKVIQTCNGNQGAIFVNQNHAEGESEFLELIGKYAYGRKKHENSRIGIGQGLVGQVFLEGGITILTDVPSSYLKTTSGLGEATPRCVIIIALEANNTRVGVMELAFFQMPEEFQLEFLRNVSENIARSIHWVKESQRTLELLNHSEVLSQNLIAQEEELRQNMEEMRAIHENMERKNRELMNSQREIEAKNAENEELNRLIESKLETQKTIYEMQLDKLRRKVEELKLQKFQFN